MTWRTTGILLNAIVVVLGMAGCGGADPTGGPGNGPFVTTGGASGDLLQDVTFTADLFTQRMSFIARGAPDNVTGQFNFSGKVFGINTHVHGDVLCYFIAGKRARVAGRITVSDPPELESLDATWTVEDNGDESSLQRDRISLYRAAPGIAADHCSPFNTENPTMYMTETGNVQLHP
ncbi:MAG: hypothetical protein ACJ8AB_07690 [Gemmatimonadaceae bacterium]